MLTSGQIKEIAQLAKCHTYYDGEIFFMAGETEFKFHVIQKGEVEIIDRSGDEPRVILTHGPKEFTGDTANLAGRTSNVEAVARGKVEVYEICATELKAIISERPDLSDPAQKLKIILGFHVVYRVLNSLRVLHYRQKNLVLNLMFHQKW